MPKFKVDIVWSGYCRGNASYEIEAMDKDEAAENWWDGKEINRETIRDDTDSEVMEVELIEEPKINRATELEYLSFFYQEADFGPADGDARDLINEWFKEKTGKELPEGYEEDEI